jgi:hypothetical protein
MKLLLFGATGSAGGSVLDVCLDAPDVVEVRAITRRPLAPHSKLRNTVHGDFLDYRSRPSEFTGVDACFFCLGKSVTQVATEQEYRVITIEYALAAARMLQQCSPSASFHYISGSGASERSRFMWARVKAEAERRLLELTDAVCWRPAGIDGKPSASEPMLYRLVRPAYRLFRPFRSLYVSGEEVGLALLQATREGVRGRIIGNAELRAIAARANSSKL